MHRRELLLLEMDENKTHDYDGEIVTLEAKKANKEEEELKSKLMFVWDGE